jgi:hypothetical protein
MELVACAGKELKLVTFAVPFPEQVAPESQPRKSPPRSALIASRDKGPRWKDGALRLALTAISRRGSVIPIKGVS